MWFLAQHIYIFHRKSLKIKCDVYFKSVSFPILSCTSDFTTATLETLSPQHKDRLLAAFVLCVCVGPVGDGGEFCMTL